MSLLTMKCKWVVITLTIPVLWMQRQLGSKPWLLIMKPWCVDGLHTVEKNLIRDIAHREFQGAG
jgi:hypothetical protein